ncbi:DUF3168 domain-containing protein [Xylophilus rhododendri]|uniref:DUF3168 domain-containing protein n=1 Tax=Xylophilus rhododendri TaxID=2697032 RepID=A0A857J824_9BURK|nr:DUF3168 domain-containing protein [Xylophilus rhododendri]QHI99363.1 DUF3168 domain-containing protein [Xylophilus rhododendri]
MSIETLLSQLLHDATEGRLYPDVADEGAMLPYATWQQAGGRTFQYLEGGQADLRESRIQFAVWDETRLGANARMRAIEAVLVAAPICAEALGALVADYDLTAELYGARQDFYIRWR